MEQTDQKFGHLNGVIHAAGIVGEKGFFNIHELDYEKCNLHFQAKVHGLYILDKILKGRDLDFCMLLSSLTPILGGLGEVAYSSSNIFMDTFTRKHNRLSEIKWISVNWDLWRINKKTLEETGIGKTLAELGILPTEGMEAMERILTLKDVPQLIVSTGDLNKRINQWVKLESLEKNSFRHSENLSSPSYSQQQALDNNFKEPKNEIEKIIANIWQDVLGINRVGIDDNFVKLGGHSLIAIKIISELRKIFKIDISISALFDSPTVAELASEIREKMVMEIAELNDEEADQILSNELNSNTEELSN
jgi:acyl carrier protein